MLIEFHLLSNYAPANLNRDETGSPKSCIFGGYQRARISSQCLKRAMRMDAQFQHDIQMAVGTRTRLLPDTVRERLVAAGVADDMASAAARLVAGLAKKDGGAPARPKGAKDKAKVKGEEDDGDEGDVGDKDALKQQLVYVSDAEIDAVVRAMSGLAKGIKDPATLLKTPQKGVIKAITDLGTQQCAPDMALFGRFLTSDAFSNIDASMQVAHAISTHAMENEFDYFTALDDVLLRKGQATGAAGMIGDREFTSACFYRYASLDVDAFIVNMGVKGRDGKKVAATVARALVRAMVFTKPSGGQNSYAAHSLPDAVLVEVRPAHVPVSYANAFAKPCSPARGDLVDASITALVNTASQLRAKYSLPTTATFWFTTRDGTAGHPDIRVPGATSCDTIDDLAEGIGKLIEQGA